MTRNDEQLSAVTSSSFMAQNWTIRPSDQGPVSVLNHVTPVTIDAKDTITLGRIDPAAEPYQPDYIMTFDVPKWMRSLTGYPAYVSVNVYVILGGPEYVKFARTAKKDEKPLLEVDFADLLSNALVSGVILRYINSHIMYIRLVAAGLLVATQAQKFKARCRLRTELNVGQWPDYTVSYHAILGCGIDAVEVDTPQPQLKERMFQAVRKQGEDLLEDIEVLLNESDSASDMTGFELV